MAAPGIREETIAFFLTVPHECGYLSGRDTVNVVVDPGLPVGTALYSRLAPLGFRRSGNRVYRPACPACAACVPLRVPVEDFLPQRSQRRAWERNSDLLVRERPPGFNAEHYALYCRYIAGRHPGGGMEETTPDAYLEFISGRGIETRLIEFMESGRCVAVAVTDVLTDALSAVYTFFDTTQVRRSLGVYAVLWQIEAARRMGKEWLYLGYWIEECRKMSYKIAYRPHELLLNGHWRRFDALNGDTAWISASGT